MRSGDFMAGILVGVLIGGALGLLFAPEVEAGMTRVREALREQLGAEIRE
jgi:gas vesicle protein